MNVGVEVGSFVVSLSATIIEPVLKTQFNDGSSDSIVVQWSCFTPTLPSINGHSLSAINPDLAMFGGQTTLILA